MTKYIPGPTLERWGACHVYQDIVDLFPGQPGVPITVEGVERVLAARLYPNPARWAAYLMCNEARWGRFRDIAERELAAEFARARAVTENQPTTLERMTNDYRYNEGLRECAESVLVVRDARRMAQQAIFRLYSRYARFLGGSGDDLYPHVNAENRLAVLWVTGMVIRVMDREEDTTAIDPLPRE